jgi:methylated-DNA-[protein]-cysteine S-methyltransferase
MSNEIYTCSIYTPLGTATAAATDDALIGFWFAGEKYYPEDTNSWIADPDHPIFELLRHWIDGFFKGKNTDPIRKMTEDSQRVTDLSQRIIVLNPRGSVFQKSVWKLLLEVPHGQMTTYGEIAGQLAAKTGMSTVAAQAVGGAVGHNPISLLIPCHRVVGADGSLTGYAGGLYKKQSLLSIEQAEKIGAGMFSG